MRFLQISDVHLGARPGGASLRLPPAKRQQWQRELGGLLRDCAAIARDERADVVLVPGDLFDHESVSSDTLAGAVDALASFGCPVVVAPGNHDFDAPAGYYTPDLLRSRYGLSWPANVHIFRGGGWTRARVPSLPDVAFTGIAFTHHTGSADGLFAALPRPVAAARNVLVFHGSRTGHQPDGKRLVLPFDDGALAAAGYEYAAIGHYHSHSTIGDRAGGIIGAYAGCAAGRDVGECGAKGILVGELGGRAVDVRFVPLDARRIHDVAVDCTGLTHADAVVRRIEERLREEGCRPRDVANVRLAGRHGPGLDLDALEIALPDRWFFVQVDRSGLVPEYELDRYRPGGPAGQTTVGRFVQAIEARLAAADDERERAVLRRALYYGLDALLTGSVTPRYERGGAGACA